MAWLGDAHDAATGSGGDALRMEEQTVSCGQCRRGRRRRGRCSSATRGALAKLQHGDEHLWRGRRTVSSGGQCGEKTTVWRAHPGGGKTTSGRARGVDGSFNPATPVSGQGPCDAWRAKWAMPPDKCPGVGLRSTDEWAPRDRISRLK
jgi:hypothetical protein